MVSTVEDVLTREEPVMVNHINSDVTGYKATDLDHRLKAKVQEQKNNNATISDNNVVEPDSVSVSKTSRQLEAIAATFSQVPEVDSIKVAQFKAAVDSGNYVADSKQIAWKMLNNAETA